MLRFRVATYNVLSSSLASPSFYSSCNADHCSSKYRLKGLLSRLSSECDAQSIICLQEVSLSWTGTLEQFFESKDYAFVISNYGSRFNGYMGVGVAYPRSRFSLSLCDISCVSDSKQGGWSGPKPTTGIATTPSPLAWVVSKFIAPLPGYLAGVVSWLLSPFRGLVKPAKKEKGGRWADETVWDSCKARNNTMVALRLKSKEVEPAPEFFVATYHMPCQFRDLQAMDIFALLCFQKLQSLSEGGKYLQVFAGDFNFKPSSSQYALVKTGELPLPHPEKLHEADSFQFRLKHGPLYSAYFEVRGTEPKFTNFAKTKDEELFKDVLDYVFFSPKASKVEGKTPMLKAVDVMDLPCDEVSKLKSLPSATEYSDHLMIAAEFELSLM